LLMAIQLSSFDEVKHVIQSCLAKGLLTDWFLFNDAAVRVAPPLIITEDEIRKACKILLAAIDELN